MKNIFLIIGSAILLNGCTITAPSVDLPSISVDSPVRVISPSSSYDGHSGGKGCPPGLAKQGRCK